MELYWPLRTRVEWGKPIPFDAIHGYLRMRGHDPADLYDWILICDAEVIGWMNDETERQRKDIHGGRSARH